MSERRVTEAMVSAAATAAFTRMRRDALIGTAFADLPAELRATWLTAQREALTAALAVAPVRGEVEVIRALLLGKGTFDDPHTADADAVADIAELVGLRVTRDERGRLDRIRSPLPTVYAWCAGRVAEYGTDELWYAMADDGEVLAEHVSSSREHGQSDVHLTFSARAERYRAKFGGVGPEFYRFVVLPDGEKPPPEVWAANAARIPRERITP